MGSRSLALVALVVTTSLGVASGPRNAQAQTSNPCGPALTGSVLPDTPMLRSTNGVLAVRMTIRQDPSQPQRMCYAYSAVVDGTPMTGLIPPTLAVHPGDRISMELVNDLPPTGNGMPMVAHRHVASVPQPRPTREIGETHLPTNYANIHFHGLNVSPQAPHDDVVSIEIPPGQHAHYNYTIDIPKNEPGGLYWYHPHIHGEAKPQVKSGLTGAILIVPAGGESVDSRVIVVRGSDSPVSALATAARKRVQRLQSNAFAVQRRAVRSRQTLATSGFPFDPPAECPASGGPVPDSEFLTVNGLNVPEPGTTTYPLPSAALEEGQTQVWHVANTAAITYLDLAMTVDGRAVPIQLVGRDGIPVGPDNGGASYRPLALSHVLLTPAGRADILVTGPAAGHTAVLSTRAVDTGCAGDSDLARDLVAIHGTRGMNTAATSRVAGRVAGAFEVRRNTRFANLASATPAAVHRLVFTEYPLADGSRTDFYVTDLNNPNAYEHPFKMADTDSITVKNGTVEDWVIENWTQEIHAFHIHQIHFHVLSGLPSTADGLGMLMDTVNVPYGGYVMRGGQRVFVPGAVRLRMDFRDPQIVGEFVYHCHVLEHEDNGMMAKIRVVP